LPDSRGEPQSASAALEQLLCERTRHDYPPSLHPPASGPTLRMARHPRTTTPGTPSRREASRRRAAKMTSRRRS
jgi:hypothetical protein